MLKRNTLKKIAVCALWVGAAGIFTACSPKGPKFQGVDLTGAEYGRDLPVDINEGAILHAGPIIRVVDEEKDDK